MNANSQKLYERVHFSQVHFLYNRLWYLLLDSWYATEQCCQWNSSQQNQYVVDWFYFCREECKPYVERQNIEIEGISEDGTSVEVDIDESKYCHHRYCWGQWRPSYWIFGDIERGSRRCFLVEEHRASNYYMLCKGTFSINPSWNSGKVLA